MKEVTASSDEAMLKEWQEHGFIGKEASFRRHQFINLFILARQGPITQVKKDRT